MVRVLFRSVCALALAVSAATTALAQDNEPEAPSPPQPTAQPKTEEKPDQPPKEQPKPKPEKTAAQKKYEDVRQRWNELEGKLIDAYQRFLIARRSKRAAIRDEYDSLLAQSDALLVELRAAAMAAYAEAPNQDKDLVKLLVGIINDAVRRDEYETAMDVANVLLQHDCQDKYLFNLAGIAAYSMDDFEKAESWLKAAEEAGSLNDDSKKLLEDVATAKELWQAEQDIRQTESEPDNLPRVRLITSKGTIVVELYENEAPQTVGNFVSLVENKFYDGLTFHRVIAGFMAQGGDPEGNGSGGPGYKIYCECFKENHRKHFRGTLSMAHSGRDTGGSQFFLTFRRTPDLDGKHTVFGRVIEGLEVLAMIQRRTPSGFRQLRPDTIIKAEIVRKRDHDYEPVKVVPAAAAIPDDKSKDPNDSVDQADKTEGTDKKTGGDEKPPSGDQNKDAPGKESVSPEDKNEEGEQ